MVTDIWAIAAIGAGLGGMLSAIVGYYGSSSNEPFSSRKFAAGIIRGFIGGMLVFMTMVLPQNTALIIGGSSYTFSELLEQLPSLALLLAILSGYVGDSIMNKISNMVAPRTLS
ncbi:MAG: hypothetical protein QXM92_00435 [Candidatus Anstonellales archaeon]